MSELDRVREIVRDLEARLQHVEDAVQVPDDQCGDWPAPCNCDDPVTHDGR